MVKYCTFILFLSSFCHAQFNTVRPIRTMAVVPNRSVEAMGDSISLGAGEGRGDGLPFAFPLDTIRINSGYGIRVHPISGMEKKHYGIDLYSNGSMVYSVLDGVVERVDYQNGYGFYIKLEGGGFTFLYAHLSHVYVSEGDILEAGQPIARTGSTGSSTGDHLHFEVRYANEYLDPVRFIKNLLRMNVWNP